MTTTATVCCLLISEDPDDHLEFTEALAEISENTVLMSISDGDKALKFLESGNFAPHFIFLNTTEHSHLVDEFNILIAGKNWKTETSLLTYNTNNLFYHYAGPEITLMDDNAYTFHDLREALRKLISSR